MVNNFLFKDRDGQTPLPPELFKGLRVKTIQTMGELDEYEERNIARGLLCLASKKKIPKDIIFGSNFIKNYLTTFGPGRAK